MSTSEAWLLECGNSLSIAVGDHEMLELLHAQRCDPVAQAPAFCAEELQRHDGTVPVMDLEMLYREDAASRDASYLCLLYYQQAPGQPLQQVALKVERAPERIRVDDAQFCEFPREHENCALRSVTLSCFTHDAKPVLIVDLSGLCSSEFRALLPH